MSSKVHESKFKLNLAKKAGPKGKAIYCIDGTPETFFVVKQLQRTINRIYGVKPSNRHDLICQIRDTLSSDFPFEIVRTDISSFYESIDRNELLSKLDTDQLLSSSSKKYIRQILSSFGSLTSETVGIPRGIGISAYLAELYLRPLDQDIKTIPGIVLYCRFVDDIVAVFARPPSGKTYPPYKDLILSALSKRKLAHNDQKTDSFQLGSALPKEFEYLGYRFTLKFGICTIAPSSTKLAKYRDRVNAAFDSYDAQSSINSRRAYRDLVARVKFLTGNTRLLNSKSSAVTGIYCNNSTANDISDLNPLDKVLKDRIELVKRPILRKRLKLFKFTDGFSERRFHNFNAKELQRIVRAWKNG